jgi:hypothetical protein
MARQKLPNYTPDAFPGRVDWDKVRQDVDADTGASEQCERDLEQLQRQLDKQAGLKD